MKTLMILIVPLLALTLCACSGKRPEAQLEDVALQIVFEGTEGVTFEGEWTTRDPSGLSATRTFSGSVPRKVVGLATEVEYIEVFKTSPDGTLRIILSQPGRKPVTRELSGEDTEFIYEGN